MRIKPIKLSLLLAVALTAVLTAAVACASEDDPTAAPAAAQAPLTRATAVVVGAAGVATEVYGKRIELPKRVAPAASLAATAVGDQHFSFAQQSLKNYKPYADGGSARPWMTWAFMTPFMWDKNNDLVQGFATAYSVSDDGKVYTFHINPAAKFTDGTKLTAAAAKRAWEWGSRPDQIPGWGGIPWFAQRAIVGGDAAADGEREDITGIVALDEETLQITLKKAEAIWPFRFSGYLHGVFRADLAEQQGEDFWLNPVGSGMYTYTSVANEILTLTPTDTYWEEPGFLTQYTVQVVADNPTQLIMFENGDLDLIFGRPSVQPSVHEPGHPMHKYVSAVPVTGMAFIRFNTARAPFEDINIRKALAHSVDLDTIVPAVWGGAAVRPLGVLQDKLKCFDPSYKGYDYNPEKAKQFLAQSTYKTADAVPLVQIQTRPDQQQDTLAYQAMQDQWKDNLGVEMKIHVVERGAEVPDDINMLRGGWGAGIPDPLYFLANMIHTRQVGQMHVNDALDALIESAETLSLDDPKRCAAANEIDLTFMNNYYILPVLRTDHHFLIQPWVLGMDTSVNLDIVTLPFVKIGVKDRSAYP